MEHAAGCEMREKISDVCTCDYLPMTIADRLRREIENFGPVAQTGCDDILSIAATTLDELEGAMQFAVEQLLAYEQAASGELYNSTRINAALDAVRRKF